MTPVRTLKAVALSLLKARVRDIENVGGMQYAMVRELLLHPAVTSQQLGLIEENSPHLWPETEEVWKALSIRTFIEIRIAVEDGKRIAVEDGWRALHRAEEAKQTAKLLALEAKLRDSRKAYDSARATSKAVDGLRIEKRRKLASSSSFNFSVKPKLSLLEKARASGRRIASMHAPPRIPQAPSVRASLLMSHSMPSKPPPPIIQTTRLVKVPRSEPPATAGPSSGRPIAPLPSRSPVPPPRTLASSPPPIAVGRCGPTTNSSIFLPKKR